MAYQFALPALSEIPELAVGGLLDGGPIELAAGDGTAALDVGSHFGEVGCADHHVSTTSVGTLSNSRALRVTSVMPRALACPAINTS